MKTIVSLLIVAALVIACLPACNNSSSKNEKPITQTDTIAMHHILQTGELYTCKMHNKVIADKPGVCPKCGMTLVKQKITDAQRKMLKEGTYTKPNYN